MSQTWRVVANVEFCRAWNLRDGIGNFDIVVVKCDGQSVCEFGLPYHTQGDRIRGLRLECRIAADRR